MAQPGANFSRDALRVPDRAQAARRQRRIARRGKRSAPAAPSRDRELHGHRRRHEGPFEKKIPPKLADQAKLTTLNYQSPMELLAERFHTSPALLSQLNRGVAMRAGREIKVPAVAPFNPETKPAADAAAGDVSIQVSKEESALRATRADGTVVFYAPVSERQLHDPLPPGDFKVLGVGWRPGVPLQPRSVLGREGGRRESENPLPAPTTRSAWSGSRSAWNTTASTARPSPATSATRSRMGVCGSPTGMRRASPRW
jgi:hypothetical protein